MAQAQEPVTISIRAKAGQRDLIDQAADRLGRSRSDFMLEAACRQAENVLLDQPPAPTDRLRRTLKTRAPRETATAEVAVASKATGPRVK